MFLLVILVALAIGLLLNWFRWLVFERSEPLLELLLEKWVIQIAEKLRMQLGFKAPKGQLEIWMNLARR